MIRYEVRRAAVMVALVNTLITGCSDSPEKLLTSAKDYLAKNDDKAAVIQLRNALKQDPQFAEARFLLGKTLLQSGDIAGAEKELRNAWELQYAPDEVVPPLARCLVTLGRHKDLVTAFSDVQLTSPQAKADLLSSLGEAHLALGNTIGARNAFGLALAAQPGYVPAQLGHARILVNAGNLDQAAALVDAALGVSPDSADAWQFRGDILATKQQVDPAIAAYRKAIEAKPDSVSAHSAIVSLLVQQNRLEDAAKQLQAMKHVAAHHPLTFYSQALLAYRQKNFSAARAAIQQNLKAAPDNPPGLLQAGAIELELKSYRQAEAYLVKFLQHAPQERNARRLLTAVYMRNGEPTKALETLKPVLDLIGKDAGMLALAGEVYISNGEVGTAANYFARAAALDPSDPAKRAASAIVRVAKGDPGAVRELERLSASDHDIRADVALIAGHMHRREYDKALLAIAVLEKKRPGSPMPHNLRGGVLLAKGDADGARRSFERALAFDAAYFPAAASLARLDLAENKPQAARQRFEGVLAKDPKHLYALLGLAALRARPDGRAHGDAGGRVDPEVVALIRKAIAAHPNEAAPHLALIRYYLGSNDPKQAAAAAQTAVAALPEHTEILDIAGETHRIDGDTAQALVFYKKMASLRPKSPQPHLRMAEAQLVAKNREGAYESLRRALDLQPDFVEAQRRLIALHIDAGRLPDAANVARQVQKQRPKEPVGYVFEGDIHATQKRWTEATAAYRAGLKQVSSSDLAVKLHMALAAMGGSGAQQFEASWLKDHPNDRIFRLHLAQTAQAQKNYSVAAQHYRKIVEAEPNNALLLNNLAWVEGRLKDPKAIEHAEQANRLAPNQPALMDTLATLLLDKGESARALDLLQKASAMSPQAAPIRLNLAKALIQAGRKEDARKELNELAKLGDKFPAQSEVARLKREL